MARVMWARIAVATLLLAAVLWSDRESRTVGAEGDGSWLDVPLAPWNGAGGAVPAAPVVGIPTQPICASRERPAAGIEESQLVAAGWRLIEAWPARRMSVSYASGSVPVTLVMATAGYDGMCRPWAFNAFVFAAEQFAGAISPVPLYSRTDGVLSGQPVVMRDGRLEAAFTRYDPRDPLCCPSRGTTRVAYELVREPAGWVLVPKAAMTAVARLPATGGGGRP